MITRRDFTKSLASAVAVSTLKTELVWPFDVPKVSARAAELYRNSFVLDCNALASIGYQLASADGETRLNAVRESGVTVLKSTIGGATGTFDDTMADIAAADELMKKRSDVFLNVRTHSDLDHNGNAEDSSGGIHRCRSGPVDKCYEFWESEVKRHLLSPHGKVDRSKSPDEYGYVASEWLGHTEVPIVLLEKIH